VGVLCSSIDISHPEFFDNILSDVDHRAMDIQNLNRKVNAIITHYKDSPITGTPEEGSATVKQLRVASWRLNEMTRGHNESTLGFHGAGNTYKGLQVKEELIRETNDLRHLRSVIGEQIKAINPKFKYGKNI